MTGVAWVRAAAVGAVLLAACSSGGDKTAVRQDDSGAGTTLVAEQSTTTTVAAGPTSTTAAPATTTTTAKASTATPARRVAVVAAEAATTTVAPTTTTSAAGATTTTTGAPASTTTSTTRALETVPALTIPRSVCSAYLEVGLPAAVDLPRLKADMEARGYDLPSSLFRDGDGRTVTNASERNLDLAQKKIDQCASDIGGPVTVTLRRGSESAGSSALGQLVKDQLDGSGLKNYKGTTVAPAA